MLADARVHTTLPAADLERARRFYEEVLGLAPDRITPAGVFYAFSGGGEVFVYPSSGTASGSHTQLGFRVDDVEAEVADLKDRGVTFESYDFENFDKATSIATFPLRRGAWFKDTEGNLLGLVQLLDPA